MPSPKLFVNDRHGERNLSDICAAIRHHILDQVTTTDPRVSMRQTAAKDVHLSSKVYSTPRYAMRGTK